MIICTNSNHIFSFSFSPNRKHTEIASAPECVAIGECGLDYNRDFSPRDVQQTVFESHIQIACDLKRAGTAKPLFLHERDAHEDFVRILEKYHSDLPNVVVHCFTGNKQNALKYLDMGFSIGLTGFVAKLKREENGLIELIQDKLLPLDRLSKLNLNGYFYLNLY